jgi:acetyl esterase/lipase
VAPSKQSEAVRRHWAAARLAFAQPGQPDVEASDSAWSTLTAEPRGVDYLETDAGGVPAMWAVPKGGAEDRVLLCIHGGGSVGGWLVSTYLGEGGDPRDPLANPLYAELSGLGPIYLQVGEDEVLLDDASRLAECAYTAGVDVRLDVFPDMQHTFQMAAGRAPEADDAIRRMADWVGPRLGAKVAV